MNVVFDEETLSDRLARAQAEHRVLDAEIATLAASALTDQIALKRLKKRKLALKDEIARLEDMLYPDIIA